MERVKPLLHTCYENEAASTLSILSIIDEYQGTVPTMSNSIKVVNGRAQRDKASTNGAWVFLLCCFSLCRSVPVPRGFTLDHCDAATSPVSNRTDQIEQSPRQ